MHLQDRIYFIKLGEEHRVPSIDRDIKENKDKVKEWEDNFQQWKQQLLELEQEEG